MKKNLLFIMPSLAAGGAEKSLITLLGFLDYQKYEVDLMLFRREGFFLDQIPAGVNVIDGGEDYRYFDGSIKRCLLYCLKSGKLALAFNRIKYIYALNKKESIEKHELVWKLLSFSLPEIEKNYTVSIGYLEGSSTYYCVDKTKADKKIGYMHSDYKKLGMNAGFTEKYFKSLNSIATVSAACAESLMKEFPATREKIVVLENIIPKTEICRLAVSDLVFKCGSEVIKLLTVARLSNEKGIDLAVKACEILCAKGYNICWYVIGNGEMKSCIEILIKEKQLINNFVLLGQQNNPYKYMAQCDIYIQPSRYEGKSIAIDEAKVLAKPIVTTNYSTVRNQIEDQKTGIIAGMEPGSIAEKIELLINDQVLRTSLSENLKKTANGNENEITKFYEIINSQKKDNGGAK